MLCVAIAGKVTVMTDTPEPVATRPAATILLVRDDPVFEVLMVKRHHQIDFASGALVFPGGKTHQGDHDPAWEDMVIGWGDSGWAFTNVTVAIPRSERRNSSP